MKKIALLMMLMYLVSPLFAQQNDPHLYKLNNPTLKEYIGVYINQTAQWAKENHYANYVAGILFDSYNNYHIIQLTVITDKAVLDKLQFTSYTEVNGTPVFVQNKTAVFFETNYVFIGDVLKKYNINLLDSKAERDRETKQYIAEHTLKADSMIFHTPEGDKKLALKDTPSVKISTIDDSDQSRPYSLELTFLGNMLQGARRYK